MGKRRKEGPHADKYNPHASEDEDEEEIENNLEVEPLKPEDMANIKSRKKLIATRRIPSGTAVSVNGSSTGTGSFGFTPFSPFNPPATNTEIDNKPSVFAGFKGFSTSKPVTTTPTTTSSTSTITLTKMIGASNEATPRPTLTISESAKPSTTITNLFSASTSESSLLKPKNSESTTPAVISNLFKPSDTTSKSDTTTTTTASTTTTSTNNANHTNISDKDLNFMNDLNELYERYYGNIKEKNFTIPSDIPNGSDQIFEQESSQDGTKKSDEDDESKKKYAYLLADLNKLCSKWISKHVEENPLVILTPVFVDYFAYLILLEKNFFPNTFKKEKPVNGSNTTMTTTSATTTTPSTTPSLSLFKSSSTNGSDHISNNTTTAAPIFGSTNMIKNGIDSENHKNLNGGFKFGPIMSQTTSTTTNLASVNSHVNGSSNNKKLEETPKKDEVEPKESDEKNLEQSSKTFASLINKTPFSQIPLTASTGSATSTTSATSSFLFKPTSTTVIESFSDKKDTTDNKIETATTSSLPTFGVTQEKSLFKFGQTLATPSVVATTTTTETKSTTLPISSETSATLPKFNLFSSSTAPTFKFGDLSKQSTPVSDATTTTPTTVITTSPPSQQKTSLFTKPTELTNNESKASNFFASLTKSTTPTSTPAVTASTTSTTPTFSSLLSGTSGSTMFKPFATSTDQTTTSSGTTDTTSATPSIFSSLGQQSTGNTTTTPFFSFQSNLGSKSSLFGQSTSTPFGKSETSSIFGASSIPAAASAEGGEGDEEEYEPPKPEVSELKEEGSVFEKRIKLYYFNDKENKFCDRGVGNLFLKPINNGESTQLIVRADTSLANILLNVKLNKIFPINKLGAKDVSYICVPNPPIPNIDSKVPCKFLFKVKTEDDAKELLEKLNEFKK